MLNDIEFADKANTLRVNKIAIKRFLKNLPFGVNFKLGPTVVENEHIQQKWCEKLGQ